jgi:hypothetical protein
MENQKVSRKSQMINIVGAGVAGGGLGSAIATIANGMSDSVYKSALIISAPLITIGISGLWLFLKTVYIDTWVNRKEVEVMRNIISDARADRELVMNDPNSTEEHKKQACEKFQNIQIFRLL